MHKHVTGTLVMMMVLGLAGCGGGGPAAGMPDDIPSSGVAPVLETKPISIKDMRKASKGPKPPAVGTP